MTGKVTTAGLSVFASLFLCISSEVLAANKSKGKSLYTQRGCNACHGDLNGNRLSDYPSLNGRNAQFIASELNKYRNSIRLDPTMNAMAAGLSDSDIEDIAAYISKDRTPSN